VKYFLKYYVHKTCNYYNSIIKKYNNNYNSYKYYYDYYYDYYDNYYYNYYDIITKKYYNNIIIK